MLIEDKVVVVTGGAHGIGRALCRRFAEEGARGVVVADVDGAAATALAKEIDGLACTVDVSQEEQVFQLVQRAREAFGRIDLFCSNAGVLMEGGIDTPDSEWQRIWQVNFMSQIYAARAVLPKMLERGEGYLLITASAAGLLSQIGCAPYAVTKHATVAIAEWLALTYGERGIRVSCLCPMGVRTRMLLENLESNALARMLEQDALSPAQVAERVVEGLAEETFLILPHPQVVEYFRNKATDYDRWLSGMARLKTQLLGDDRRR